ncbi:MAG: putative porin [Polyangiaceae bacterium]|nr:putative porin [Polyangiaceae bacterium]
MQKRLGKAVVLFATAAIALGACAACSKLTEPAAHEPMIQSEQATGAERKQVQPAAPSPPGSVRPEVQPK